MAVLSGCGCRLRHPRILPDLSAAAPSAAQNQQPASNQGATSVATWETDCLCALRFASQCKRHGRFMGALHKAAACKWATTHTQNKSRTSKNILSSGCRVREKGMCESACIREKDRDRQRIKVVCESVFV